MRQYGGHRPVTGPTHVFNSRDKKTPENTSVRTSGNLPEIRTVHIQNTSLTRFNYENLIRGKFYYIHTYIHTYKSSILSTKAPQRRADWSQGMLAIIWYKIFCLTFRYKKLKIKIHRNIILPVVLYGCETWSLTLREECRLRVFENRLLRR